MDRLADLCHSAKAKRQVRNSSTDLHIRTLLLDGLHCVDEVNTIVGVLLHTGTNGQHIRIEYNILGRELYFVHQNVI